MSQEDDSNNNNNSLQSKILTCAAVGASAYIAYKTFFSTYTYQPSHTYHEPSGDELVEYPRGEKYWVTNPWEEVNIRLSKKGPNSWKPYTIFEVVEKAVTASPNASYLHQEKQDNAGNWTWKHWTRQEFYEDVLQAARAFIQLGLKPWESVVIIGFNSPEWFMADLAAIYAGGLAAGIYTTNNPGQCQYIAEHCKARIAVCENEKQAEKFLQIRDKLPNLDVIVIWDGKITANLNELNNKNKNTCKLLTWDDFLHIGEGTDEDNKKKLNEELNLRKKKIKPGNCCTLIYTSGTTGPPKAVMISHDNITWNVRCLLHSLEDVDWSTDHHIVSYLPLSHIAAQFVDIHAPMGIFAWHGGGGGVWFARPDALKGSIGHTLKAARPTIFFGVPRVWEKIEEKMREVGASSGFIAKQVGTWAKGLGTSYHKAIQIDGNKQIPSAYDVANKFVFNKIRTALGFDRLKYGVVGAAPVKKSTLDYFGSIGISIVEVYGMSECTGAHSVGRNFFTKVGSVGPTLYGIESVIVHDNNRDKQGEGEICMRGRHVMMGYMYDPDKTKGCIDNEGLLHSGDVGRQDENHLLYITGRIKELIITAGGENVAPVPIEDYIKTQAPAISNVVTIGDQKKYMTCLITLKCEQDADSGEFNNKLVGAAALVSEKSKTVDDARKDPVWNKYIDNAIKKYNSDKDACVSNAQTIQYFKILDGDFSIPGGELTSTLKLKRQVIVDKYAKIIDSMY